MSTLCKTFYFPFQNHCMRPTLKTTDDLPGNLNLVSLGAGLWLPVCSCFLDLSYTAIFASSGSVLLFSCRKYVGVGKESGAAGSVFHIPPRLHSSWASVFSSVKGNNNVQRITTFTECFLCALCCPQHFMCNSLNPTKSPGKGCYFPHFTDEYTKSQTFKHPTKLRNSIDERSDGGGTGMGEC